METKQQSWYCLKAKTKREHIAAGILRAQADFDVFCPRVTLTKKTVKGPKAFTEALFPGYLFCQFNFEESSRQVNCSQGIIGIVKFGKSTPTVPQATIRELQKALPKETAEIAGLPIKAGELAEIIIGCFAGESGRVLEVETATQRVNLLIEFLGTRVPINVPAENVINPNPSNVAISLGLTPTT